MGCSNVYWNHLIQWQDLEWRGEWYTWIVREEGGYKWVGSDGVNVGRVKSGQHCWFLSLPHCEHWVTSVMSDSTTPWTVALQAPLSVGFSRQESWSGLPRPSPGDLPNQGMEPKSLTSSALAGRFLIFCFYHWHHLERPKSTALNPLVSVAQSCPTLCDPRDGSLPGSSVHGIL